MTSVKTRVPVLGTYKRHKLRLLEASRGLPGYIDAEPVRLHIEWLRSIGFTDGAIAVQAGVTTQMIALIRAGQHVTTQRRRAQPILAVTHVPTSLQARTLVPALGLRRRLHALQAIGYSTRTLATLLDVPQNHICRMSNTTQVLGSTWMKVDDLYKTHSGAAGPSKSAATIARRKGYAAPLDWDGIDIDHPDHAPAVEPELEADNEYVDPVVLDRILSGRYTGEISKATRNAVLDYAIGKGWGWAEVAPLLDLKKEAADQALVRRRRKLREQAAA
ncbi:hypothetical protein [Nocardia sp. NPDC004860]|uniref:hypothetical protein n=1 Tax=Nocardia sp. NPDC004860 TaxID=3154557 RepID=UPI0033AD6B75